MRAILRHLRKEDDGITERKNVRVRYRTIVVGVGETDVRVVTHKMYVWLRLDRLIGRNPKKDA